MMDLHNYPLDVQNCTVEIESCKYLILSFYVLNYYLVTLYYAVIYGPVMLIPYSVMLPVVAHMFILSDNYFTCNKSESCILRIW